MYIDGTSCATPAFGGLVTLINDVRLRNGQPALGFLNPLLYVRCVGNPPLKRVELMHRLAAVLCRYGAWANGTYSFVDIQHGNNRCAGRNGGSGVGSGICCSSGFSGALHHAHC